MFCLESTYDDKVSRSSGPLIAPFSPDRTTTIEVFDPKVSWSLELRLTSNVL